ncbi:MAG: DNA polymerase III subunit delta [Deltaproteobacteria bacterium]|nr:DNA polymerase III subunit delta [Deltaproteobacteria bacterium]
MKAAPVVYIYGDESFLVARALAEVEGEALGPGAAELNREVYEAPGASPAAVVSAAKTLPFLGGRRLVVVRSAHLWLADAWQPVLPYLGAPNPSTCLVFVAATLDKRTKAGKALEKAARLVECRRPSERELPGWAERLAREAGLRPGPGVLESVVLRVGPDLQLLHQEIEKLRTFAGEGGGITREDVEALVGESRATTVFVFCDALGARDLAAATRTLRRLLQLGEPPVRLLYMIHRHVRLLWSTRELLDERLRADRSAVAAAVGVPPFVADGLLRQAKGWRAEDLRDAFHTLVATDVALKTGAGAEALDALVLRLCARRR